MHIVFDVQTFACGLCYLFIFPFMHLNRKMCIIDVTPLKPLTQAFLTIFSDYFSMFILIAILFLIVFFFFVINIFLFIFSHTTTQHPLKTNKTKQQTHTPCFKSPNKGEREREGKNNNKTGPSSMQSHILRSKYSNTQVRLTAEFKPAIFGNIIFRVYIKYSQSQNCIQQMKRSNITPIL